MNWSDKVNKKISLDGEYNYKDGFTETLTFESGKERTWLKNNFIPRVFPELSLTLNHQNDENIPTEYDEFIKWYEVSLRYGILPFYFPRLGYVKKQLIKTGETGIYKIIPDTLTFDRLQGIVIAGFGLEEIGYINEVEHIFLATENDEILLTENGNYIVI